MAITFPAPETVGVPRMLDYGHAADYIDFRLTAQGQMGNDWMVAVRVTDKGAVQKPIIQFRSAGAYQRPQFEPVPAFVMIPDDVQRLCKRITNNLKRAIREARPAPSTKNPVS